MAEPTLKDVLKAISELRVETKDEFAQVGSRFDRVEKQVSKLDGDLSKLDGDVSKLRGETKAEFAQVGARFDGVEKQLTELDRDLTKHMDVHREIEKDLEALKARPPRTAARAPRRPRTR